MIPESPIPAAPDDAGKLSPDQPSGSPPDPPGEDLSAGLTLWSREGIAGLFASVASPAASDPAPPGGESDVGFRRACAVLASFDPGTLCQADGSGPAGVEALTRLLPDCGVEESSTGHARWHLKPAARRSALMGFVTRDEVRSALKANESALKANERDDYNSIQAVINRVVEERPLELDKLGPDELSAAVQVVQWFSGVPSSDPFPLPTVEEVQRRLEHGRLVAPLRRLVGEHFRGRVADLAAFQAYVADPKAGVVFALWGVGGMGKSSLLAKSMLEQFDNLSPSRPLCAYLDFDRPSLLPEEPATLLLDAMSQLRAQDDRLASGLEPEQSRLREGLVAHLRSSRDVRGSYLETPMGAELLDRICQFVRNVAGVDRPVLFALDTFEEVQYRSKLFTDQLRDFFSQLRKRLPASRAILAGRSKLERQSEKDQRKLEALDREAAVGCLQALGVEPNVASFLFEQVGGNPLNLRLAAEVVRREKGAKAESFDFRGAEFAGHLRDALIQGHLVRRILEHTHDEDVRRLASPGLVLRKIDPELIWKVLSGVCGVKVKSLERAREIYSLLEKETALVEIGDTPGELRYRPDVRREVLRLLVAESGEQVEKIHRKAVMFYSKRKGERALAEEIYHRLALGQGRDTLDRRWDNKIKRYLGEAIEELPTNSRAYLASKLGLEFSATHAATISLSESASIWEGLDLFEKERLTARQVRDALHLRQFHKAKQLLDAVPNRTKDSPLFVLEARTLKWLGRWEEARDVLEKGIRAAGERNRENLLNLHVYQVRVALHLGDRTLAARELVACEPLVESHANPDQRLSLALARLQLAEPNDKEAARGRLRAELSGLSKRSLQGMCRLAPRVAAEFVHEPDLELVLKVIQVCGLPDVRLDAIEKFGAAMERWDAASSGSLRSIAGISPSDPGREWHSWVARRANERDGSWLIALLNSGNPLPSDVRDALADLLQGVEEEAELRTSEAHSGHEVIREFDQSSALHSAILRLLPEPRTLDAFIHGFLNVNPSTIIGPSGTQTTRVYELVKWCVSAGRTEDLLGGLARIWPSDPELLTLMDQSNLPQPTVPGSPEESARCGLKALALAYDRIRNTMKVSNERTAIMNGLVAIMLNRTAEVDSWVDETYLSSSAGMRLSAIVALGGRPDERYLTWLSERGEAESWFLGLLAALALLEAAKQAPFHQLMQVEVAVEKALSGRGSEDPNQRILLQEAKKLLRRRANEEKNKSGE